MSDKREDMISYLQHCVSENLNHARHVENERLSFTSIYTAIVVGSVAVVFGLESTRVAFVVAALLTGFGFLAMQLNGRWQEVFDKHLSKAADCDKQWRELIERDQSGYLFKNYTVETGQKPHEGRTKRTFAALYKAIFLALLGLTLYLGWQALQSPIGTGFYFSDKAITDLENVLNLIVEEAKK